MSKDQVIEQVTEYLENMPDNTGLVQVVLLGDGGYIDAQHWDVEKEIIK